MKQFVISILLLIPALLYANGGPVDESNLYRFGIITPINENNIFLTKELLIIKIEGDHSNVTVFYTLQNNGQARKVQYGFPVDWDQSESEIIPDNDKNTFLEKGIIPSFMIFDGNNKLTFTSQPDPNNINVNVKADNNDEVTIELKRKWFITELSFEAGEKKELQVQYYLKNNLLDWSTSKSAINSYSNRMMTYDFTPAKNWGNGKVNDLKIIVDISDIIRNYGTCTVTGLKDIINCDGKFIYEGTDVEFGKLESMNIIYDNSIQNRSNEITRYLFKSSKDFTLRVSSELPASKSDKHLYGSDYSVRNLADWNFQSAWVEGIKGAGIGQYIDITFKKGFILSYIAIINGYLKSKDTYYNNNRIKKLQVDCFNKDGKIDTLLSRTITLEDLPFTEVNQLNFAKMLSTIIDFGDAYCEYNKIRLTIKDVYPGEKFNDTGISELLVWGYMDVQ